MSTDKIARRQWPAALLFLAGGIRAGLTIDNAFALLAREAPEPLRSRLARAVAVDGASAPLSARIHRIVEGEELALPRAALLFSHRVGGHAAPLLERCARSLQSKIEMEDRLAALTAQSRFSAWIIGATPFGILLFFGLFAPDYIAPLFKTPLGGAALAFSFILVASGLALARKMTKLE